MKIYITLGVATVVLGLAACENPTATNAGSATNHQAEANKSPFRWKNRSINGRTVTMLVMADLPGGVTRADPQLKKDVLALIAKAEAKEGRADLQIKEIEPLADGREVWILNSAHGEIAYIIRFKPSPQGGTDIEMSGGQGYHKERVDQPVPAPSVPAYEVSKAMQAGGKALAQARNTTEFYFYNIPPGRQADPAIILKFMRDCRDARRVGAIGSDRPEMILEILQSALIKSEGERFDGLVLVIVAARKDPDAFDAILRPRGIIPVYAAY